MDVELDLAHAARRVVASVSMSKEWQTLKAAISMTTPLARRVVASMSITAEWLTLKAATSMTTPLVRAGDSPLKARRR